MLRVLIGLALLLYVVTPSRQLLAAEPPAAPPDSAKADKPGQDPSLPTIFVVGDSTARNGTKGQQGWGDPFGEMVDRSKANYANRARGGRSSRTFQTEGLWDAVLADAKPGDVVLIQFGHNDGGPLDDTHRARGSIRGTGEESQEIYNPIRKVQEVVHTFGWYMRKYVADAKAKGMKPIVLSYVPRCPKPDQQVDPDAPLSGYALWAKEVAESEGVPFVNAYGLIQRRYVGQPPEELKAKYFPDDFLHTNADGARVNAEAVAEGIRAEVPELVEYLLSPDAAPPTR